MPARRRSAQLGTLLATLLLAAGCGSSQPAALKAAKPDVPSDLCASIPATARANLIANSDSDDQGNPTAACSLRSADGDATKVAAVVTWLETNNDQDAVDVLGSQCRAIDHTEFRDQIGFQPQGADKSCGASGRVNGADSATMAAVKGNEVVTVRLSTLPQGQLRSFARAQEMLEGVLSSQAGS